MVYFHTKNPNFCVSIFEGLGVENFGVQFFKQVTWKPVSREFWVESRNQPNDRELQRQQCKNLQHSE
jgi:hypothetical protein